MFYLFYYIFPLDVVSKLFVLICSLSFTKLLFSNFQACLFYVFQLGSLSITKSSLLFCERY